MKAARRSTTQRDDDDGETLYRLVDSVPPPDGANDEVTAMGDWSLALAEMERAASSKQATSKLEAFDLAAALAAAQQRDSVVESPVSGTRLRTPAPGPAPDAVEAYDVVAEVTIDADADADAAVQPAPAVAAMTNRRAIALTVGRVVLDAACVAAVVALAAAVLSH